MSARKPLPAPSDAWCSMCKRTGVDGRKVAPTVGEYAGDGIHHVRLCPCCMEAIGRAWQEATTVEIETGYRRRYPNGTAGCLHDDAREAGQLDEVSEREFAGSKLVKVTTRRRRIAALAERGGR